jgi:hypothetical protein
MLSRKIEVSNGWLHISDKCCNELTVENHLTETEEPPGTTSNTSFGTVAQFTNLRQQHKGLMKHLTEAHLYVV